MPSGIPAALFIVLQARPVSCTKADVKHIKRALKTLLHDGLGSFSYPTIREIHQNVFRYETSDATANTVARSSRCEVCYRETEEDVVGLPVCGHVVHPTCVEEHMLGSGERECPVVDHDAGPCPNELTNNEMQDLGIEMPEN